MSPILDLQRRLHEAGRIRIGVQVPTGKQGKTRPAKLTTLRFTGQDRRALERVAPTPLIDAKPAGEEAPPA